jgi:hypothetical protein
MPKVSSILSAMRVARVIGQVPIGHFDHDADCAIGPYIASDQIVPTTSLSDEADPTAVVYEEYQDPRTGEPLLRPVKKS